MRASRLLSILILLQLRVRLTADALAEEFEVSVRTIYRDIDALSAAGIPVYGDRGPGGGFQLLEGYRTKLTGLDSDEAEAMFMIGMPGPAAALGLGAAAGRARGKMLASLTPEGSAGADRVASRFHLDIVDWYRTSDPVTYLPTITRAVLDQTVVSIRYESWVGTRNRQVEPLGLVLKGGSWYMVAQVGKDVRTYKVSNIQNLAVLETKFVRPADFDLPVYWTANLKRFEEKLRQETAILRASPTGLKRLRELGAFGTAAVDMAEPDVDGGWAQVRLPYENVEQGGLMLLGIGPEIQVVAPDILREHMKALARAVIGIG